MTQYYIDSDNGNDANTGLAIGAGFAWATFNKFTENPRIEGDIATARRNRAATYDDGGDLAFSSDGDPELPIILEADFDDYWGDEVDLSGTATATLTFGSKTITFSADVSGVVAAGDWIYALSDDNREFAYEVDTVSTVTVTLFLPYKGDQDGSGKTMFNMQSPPVWNTAAGNFSCNIDSDHNWKFQGIHFRGTDVNGNVEIDSARNHIFKDCIFEGNDDSDKGIYATDDQSNIYVKKCRFYNFDNGAVRSSLGNGAQHAEILDCLMDSNNNLFSANIFLGEFDIFHISETEMKGAANEGDISLWNASSGGQLFMRNCILSSATQVQGSPLTFISGWQVASQDHNGEPGDTAYYSAMDSAIDVALMESETAKVRGGGSNESIKVTPGTQISKDVELRRVLLFELPIHATTVSKTYTVYFASDDNADWTADPAANELWIELEAWGHATNDHRRIKKSAGAVDFSTDTDFDQSLAVTVAPAQAGIAILRCFYAKPKEAGNANVFYCDPIPVVS